MHNDDESTKLWLPLDGKTLKLVRKQLDVFSDEEFTATKGQLEFPDILDVRTTMGRNFKEGQRLPNLHASYLRRFTTVIVKFTLKSWAIGVGGISVVLQEVIAIDSEMGPSNLDGASSMAVTPSLPREER